MTTLDPGSIVVLGGSFNPPTLAHRFILAHALARTGAGLGLLVPSSHAYVSRKAKRQKSPFLFTEHERLAMLEATVEGHADMAVDTCEYGDDGRGRTYETLCRIQDKYPGRTVCFLTGADKLRIIPRWHEADALLSKFPIVAMSRRADDARSMISSTPLLRAHVQNFLVIPELPGIANISSSEFQHLYAKGDPKARNLVDPTVYAMIRKTRNEQEKEGT